MIYINYEKITKEQMSALGDIFNNGRKWGAAVRGGVVQYRGNPHADDAPALRELWFDGYFEGMQDQDNQ